MCSISGAIIFNSKPLKVWYKLKHIIINAEERGRDSFGLVTIDIDEEANKYISRNTYREINKPSKGVSDIPDSFITPYTKFILNNNRAEPTNEYVKNKTLSDVQPFIFKNITLTHNGTIANDRELCSEKLSTEIDTARLAYYLNKNWKNNIESLKQILFEKVIGSFALAIHNKNYSDKLYLACNYKPLYIQYDRDLDSIFFSSFPEYFGEDNIYFNTKTQQIPPYSVMEINSKTREIKILSFFNDNPSNQKVLIICSGGLDSVVVANHYALRGYKIDLIHFKYKCRAEEKEVQSIEKVAAYLSDKYSQNIKIHYVETDIFKNFIGHSRLTDTDCDLMLKNKGEASVEFAYENVPCRNLVMYSVASAFAEANKYDIIALGNNLEEGGTYSDNEAIFSRKFNDVLPYSLNLNNHLKVEAPISHLMKHEIVKKGMEENAPLNLTWSCYQGKDKHCGICGPCYMRKVAFKMNNLTEVIDYEDNTIPEKFN